MDWLKKEARGKQVFLYIIGAVFLHLAWSLSALEIMRWLNISIPLMGNSIAPIFTPTLPILIFVLALMEEVFFRLPLAFVVRVSRYFSVKSIGTALALASAFFLSILFGLCHGSVYHIFLQGVGGFIYSILFLKCGGYQGKYLKPLMASTAVHFLFNMSVLGIAAAQGVAFFP